MSVNTGFSDQLTAVIPEPPYEVQDPMQFRGHGAQGWPPDYTATRWTPGVHGGTLDVLSKLGGQVDPHEPEIGPAIVVNPREFGIPGWGDWNNQQFQSGHTNNLVTNESADQGWGVGPERVWPHYPTPDNPNPYRAKNIHRRMGTDTYSDMIYRPEVVAYWAQALGLELTQEKVKHRFTGRVVVNNQAPSVPYVTTVTPMSPGGY
jgi:hypothetical protein